MVIRPALSRLAFRLSGWRMVGEVPQTGIFVGAPHTSNWDFVATLMTMWHGGVPVRVLVKQEMFRGPLGWLIKLLGGIPIDRQNPAGVVQRLAAEAEPGKPFVLILAAEGTRTRTDHWKSGFYRIATATGLPVILGFIDGPTKTMGIGPTLAPTGDIRADMDFVRAFYADKQGIKPVNKSDVRLREEIAAAPEG